MSEEITQLLKKMEMEPNFAMSALWKHFFERLVQRAKLEISKRPQRTKDEEDVALEALNSFYNGLKGGRFQDIQNRDDLWRVLVMLATRKASRAYRDNRSQKRGGGKVRGESIFEKSPEGIEGVNKPSNRFADEILNEMLECLGELDDPMLRKIAQMKLEGFTNKEIAEEMGVVTRTIDRKIQRIKNLWEHL